MESITTLDELKDILADMGFEDTAFLEHPDFISAVVGIDTDGRVIYDYELMVEHLLGLDEGWTREGAEDYIEYNVINHLPLMGVGRPIIRILE